MRIEESATNMTIISNDLGKQINLIGEEKRKTITEA
jgi:hypothetical protein